MSRQTVELYTLCWDEADMLGFFFRHYDPWVDRYVVYDDGSTDGSLDILQAHPGVEIRRFPRSDPDSFVLSHRKLQNEVWKESRGRADWVVVTALDEHLWVRGGTMRDYLAQEAERGTTLIPALGFDMNGPALPEDRGLLIDQVTRGQPHAHFNKLSIFNPDALVETRFEPGRHLAVPVGRLRYPERDAVMLWHFKHVGFERNHARETAQAARLGAIDNARAYGAEYHRPRDRRRAEWDAMERAALDFAAVDYLPDRACARPLWWRLT